MTSLVPTVGFAGELKAAEPALRAALERAIDAANRRIDKILAEHEKRGEKDAHLAGVLQAVVAITARHHGIGVNTLLGPSRQAHVCSARRQAAVVMCRVFGTTYEQCGEALRRHRTTIIHSLKIHDNLMYSDHQYRKKYVPVADECRRLSGVE